MASLPHRRTPLVVSPGRPAAAVVLATLGVPFDPEGERVAVETALETGARLVLVNVRQLPLAPTTMVLCGPDAATLPHEEARAEVRASAERAAALGLDTLLLRVATRRATRALLEVSAEQAAGLLVFAPERHALRGLRYRLAARAIRARAPCLVWLAVDRRPRLR